MMFLKKKTVLLLFKLTCLIFVTFLLFVFIKVLCVNEKYNSQIIKTENGENCLTENIFTKSQKSFFDANYSSKRSLVGSEDKEEGSCYTKYLLYYVYALILGAYINVKRLYKMGPI